MRRTTVAHILLHRVGVGDSDTERFALPPSTRSHHATSTSEPAGPCPSKTLSAGHLVDSASLWHRHQCLRSIEKTQEDSDLTRKL